VAHKNPQNISPMQSRQKNNQKSKPKSNPKGAPQALPPKADSGGKKSRLPLVAASLNDHKKPAQIFTLQEANDRLYDLFRNHDMEHITHEQRLKLAQFYVLLMETQKVHNFTRLVTFRDIAIKHFIDCLIVPKLTQLQFPLLDVGTGPGFPGIPLKILLPDERIILAEGVQKRVEFLKQARETLALPKLDIIGKNILTGFSYPVKGVITRAVEDVRNTLRNVVASVELGGKVFLMKGPNVGPEMDVAKNEMGEFYRLDKDIEYKLPHSPHLRRLLVYEKIKSPSLEWLDQWAEKE